MEPTKRQPSPSQRSQPQWAVDLTRLLDDAVRIPGTNIGIGLDALIGFILPSAGDAITAVGAFSLVLLAFQLRVPKVVLLRMILNIGIDAIVGAVPILGDLFDVAFKSNRRNLDLIQTYAGDPTRKPDFTDYALIALALLCVIALIAIPLLVTIFLLGTILEAIR